MNQAEEIENLTPDSATVSPSGSLFVIDGRVQLRTLTRIRWIAIIGQLMALFWVQFGLNWSLPINFALLVVGISVLLNLVMTLFLAILVLPTLRELNLRCVPTFSNRVESEYLHNLYM